MENEKTYPIKAVSQITGLSVHVIRAWEKRYNAVTPIRTDTNRRLYLDNDVEKLNLLLKLTEKGYNIGGIAGMSLDALKKMFQGDNSSNLYSESFSEASETDPHVYIDKCLSAIQNFNASELETTILNASIALSQPVLFEQVFIPLAVVVGDKWKSGELRIYQEHLFSDVVKTFLLDIIDKSKNNTLAPSLSVAIPQQQKHEIAALIAAAYAAADGWRVSYLSPNLPAEEILAASLRLNSKVVVLSVVYTEDHAALKKDILKYAKALPKDVKLIVGGLGAERHQNTLSEIDSIFVRTFNDFREVISNLKQIYLN